ncbi:MAG TPA: dephospho-CoA kinase, partial [Sediminispirochaeta sp.]|nr:dephospho-CoA kinase [Sediminispirochaeta sp.]
MGHLSEAPVVGLTGKACAGKDEAAELFRRRGWLVLDVDAYGHRALEVEKERVLESFGYGVRGNDGRIDRKKLGALVFADRDSRDLLESIVHPRMKQEVAADIEEARLERRPVCLNAALLFKMDLHLHCERVLMIKAPLLLRVWRARRRDGLPIYQIIGRMISQRALFAKKKMENVDIYTVWNYTKL